MEIIPVKIIPINNNFNDNVNNNNLNNILNNNLNNNVNNISSNNINLGNNLRSKDDQFVQILSEIEYKKKMLLDKENKIKQITNQNEFLENIKNDYYNYHSYITKQKQDQLQALNALNQYVNDLTVSGNLSKHNMRDAKIEQKKIIQEIDSIKTKLDELVKNTQV